MSSRPHAKSRHPRLSWLRIAAIAVVVLVLLLVSRHWLSLDTLRAHRHALHQFVAAHYWGSLVLLGTVTLAQTAISLPFSPFLVILGGMVFGLWVGGLFMVVATTVGSVLALLVVRHMARDRALARIERHPKAQDMLDAFDRHPNSYLLFLRVEPGVVLWLANIVCALTDVSVLRFSLLTLVGVIPDTFVFTNIGTHLAKVRSLHDVLSPGIILALSLLAVLALVPVAIERWRKRAIRRR